MILEDSYYLRFVKDFLNLESWWKVPSYSHPRDPRLTVASTKGDR